LIVEYFAHACNAPDFSSVFTSATSEKTQIDEKQGYFIKKSVFIRNYFRNRNVISTAPTARAPMTATGERGSPLPVGTGMVPLPGTKVADT
jgi:hypothetical protein